MWDDPALFDRIVGRESASLTGVLTNASDFVMVVHCNDETGLEPNRSIDGNPIRGTFVACSLGPDDHGLSEDDAAKIKGALNEQRA